MSGSPIIHEFQSLPELKLLLYKTVAAWVLGTSGLSKRRDKHAQSIMTIKREALRFFQAKLCSLYSFNSHDDGSTSV
jgi:hypothetical protein